VVKINDNVPADGDPAPKLMSPPCITQAESTHFSSRPHLVSSGVSYQNDNLNFDHTASARYEDTSMLPYPDKLTFGIALYVAECSSFRIHAIICACDSENVLWVSVPVPLIDKSIKRQLELPAYFVSPSSSDEPAPLNVQSVYTMFFTSDYASNGSVKSSGIAGGSVWSNASVKSSVIAGGFEAWSNASVKDNVITYGST